MAYNSFGCYKKLGDTMNKLFIASLWAILFLSFGTSLFPSSPVMAPVLEKFKRVRYKSKLGLYSPRNSPSVCATCNTRRFKCTCKNNEYYCRTCQTGCEKCLENTICLVCLVDPADYSLACNHAFCEPCIRQWDKKSPNKDCPSCRKPIIYKDKKLCEMCHEYIDAREKTCFYECEYRDSSVLSTYHTDKHFFHEECIRTYALKAGYKHYSTCNNKVFTRFHCPVKHKENPNQGDIQVSLTSIIPAHQFKNIKFPTKSEEKNSCEICHRSISQNQKKIVYTCNLLVSNLWGTEEKREHMFHDACLKPLAERTAYKRLDGTIVFYCPVNHGYVLRQSDIVVPLPGGYKPEHIFYRCSICEKRVEPKDPTLVVLSYNGIAKGFTDAVVHEKLWYHKKCWGKHVAEFARKRVSWWGVVSYRYVCPRHNGTDLEHDFVIPNHLVEAPSQ